MTSPGDRQLLRQQRWPAGVENGPDELSLSRSDKGAAIALRQGENIDLDASGKAARRSGYARVGASARVHSLWSDDAASFGLVVQNGTLNTIGTGAVMRPVRAGLDETLSLSYALSPQGVYWSNDAVTGLVRLDGSDADWGIATPAAPRLSAVAGVGGLAAGSYQVTATWMDTTTGEESGAPLAAAVDVLEGGGIAVAPAVAPRAGLALNLYRTESNGTKLRRVPLANAAAGAALGQQYLGAELKTQLLEPMPAGACVAWFAGRTWSAHANYLTFSDAYRPGLTAPLHNRIGFADDITMLAPLADGMYVGTKTGLYWLGGTDPAQMAAARCYAGGMGVVAGTALRVMASAFHVELPGHIAYWLCNNGVACLGLPGGIVTPLKDGRAVAPEAARGASVYRDENGRRQVVTTLVAASERGLAIGDRADCEIVRHDK